MEAGNFSLSQVNLNGKLLPLGYSDTGKIDLGTRSNTMRRAILFFKSSLVSRLIERQPHTLCLSEPESALCSEPLMTRMFTLTRSALRILKPIKMIKNLGACNSITLSFPLKQKHRLGLAPSKLKLISPHQNLFKKKTFPVFIIFSFRFDSSIRKNFIAVGFQVGIFKKNPSTSNLYLPLVSNIIYKSKKKEKKLPS